MFAIAENRGIQYIINIYDENYILLTEIYISETNQYYYDVKFKYMFYKNYLIVINNLTIFYFDIMDDFKIVERINNEELIENNCTLQNSWLMKKNLFFINNKMVLNEFDLTLKMIVFSVNLMILIPNIDEDELTQIKLEKISDDLKCYLIRYDTLFTVKYIVYNKETNIILEFNPISFSFCKYQNRLIYNTIFDENYKIIDLNSFEIVNEEIPIINYYNKCKFTNNKYDDICIYSSGNDYISIYRDYNLIEEYRIEEYKKLKIKDEKYIIIYESRIEFRDINDFNKIINIIENRRNTDIINIKFEET